MRQISMNRTEASLKKFRAALPKQTLTGEIQKRFDDFYEGTIKVMLLKALLQEIEIFKRLPKANATFNLEEFDPRNPRTCFMGQGFFSNGRGLEAMTDADLVEYRNAVGRFQHPVWGHCTVLEMWGGDHFTEWPDMVKGVLAYCMGERDELPHIEIKTNLLRYDPSQELNSQAHKDFNDLVQRGIMWNYGLNPKDLNDDLTKKSKGK